MTKKIIAFVMALTIGGSLLGCNKEDTSQAEEKTTFNDLVIPNEDEDETTKATTTKSEDTTTQEDDTTTVVTTEEPKHESPVETITYSMCGQVSDIDETMDYDDNKNKKVSLKDLVPSGARVESFKFIFYSDSGANIGTYKGGCGISLQEDCPSATDDSWYQSDDFTAKATGSYLEVYWEVPSDVRDYVDTDGNVQIGYWWSDTKQLRLSEVICSYTNTVEIPCDETQSKDYSQTLTYSSDDTATMEIPLSDLVSDGNVPQYVSINVSGGTKIGKLVMGMGINQGDDYYESPTLVKLSTNGSETLTWVLTDDVKANLDNTGKLSVNFWWGDLDSITLNSVEVKSAVADGTVATTTKATEETSKNATEEDAQEGNAKAEEDIKTITSAEIVADMKIGWNLGNSLDSYDTDSSKITGSAETYWGNPKTTKAMIDKVKEAGFNAIRIPVSWTNHIDSNDQIDQEWLARVKEVVDYVIDDGMYAIINVHHDDYTWFNPTYADQEEVTQRLTDIWTTLSNEFKDYDQHLLFEGMNEPRVIGGTDEWTSGTSEERDVINQLAQSFVDTVRATGGNNQYRTLIVTTHAAALDETAVKALKVPDDDRVIVSVHYYSPYDFAGNESSVSTWGSDTDKANLDKGFKLLNDTFVSKGIPVIIGEFGTVDKDNDSTRATYYEYYTKSAKQYGITCFIWDNGGDFNLFDRTNLSWYNYDLVTALMNGVK